MRRITDFLPSNRVLGWGQLLLLHWTFLRSTLVLVHILNMFYYRMCPGLHLLPSPRQLRCLCEWHTLAVCLIILY
jgi:hypothetical protein